VYANDANGNKYVAYTNCGTACRELPYPSSTPMCATYKTQLACSQLPVACKVTRYVVQPSQSSDPTGYAQYNAEYSKCPSSCKVVPPLNPNCNGTLGTGNAGAWDASVGANDRYKCMSSRFDCRAASRSSLNLRPQPAAGTPDDAPAYQKTRCLQASDCVAPSANSFKTLTSPHTAAQALTVAQQSCVYVMPETGTCDDLCPGCPVYCRLTGTLSMGNLPADCKNSAGNALSDACTACVQQHDSCTVSMTLIKSHAPVAPNCSACPAEMRILYPDLPSSYMSGGCSLQSCPADYRESMPRSACEACLFAPEAFTYDPPVDTQCSDLCAPSDNAPVGKAGDYMNVGAEGIVGKPEIQDIAKLMVPIYVLPLFNIVATLVFITALSGFLGGDIEIPGLSKVF